jgi:hypothetical protein
MGRVGRVFWQTRCGRPAVSLRRSCVPSFFLLLWKKNGVLRVPRTRFEAIGRVYDVFGGLDGVTPFMDKK